jgi:hypothetical protein
MKKKPKPEYLKWDSLIYLIENAEYLNGYQKMHLLTDIREYIPPEDVVPANAKQNNI